MDLSVVIPAYRSQLSLPELLERLLRVLDTTGLSYEIVLVDDGSPDATWEVLCAHQRRFPDRIRLVQLMRNFGQHNALMCGLREARGRLVATMDDDLQHRPEDLPRLLARQAEGDYDLVYGGYRIRRHNFVRNMVTIPVLLFYQHVFRSRIAPTSFRVMRRELVESILHYRHAFTVVDGLLAWNTNRIGRVYIEHCRRSKGRSTYSLSKLVLLAFDLFTNFSIAPLRWLAWIGVLLLALGLGAGLWFGGQWAVDGAAPAESVRLSVANLWAAVGVLLGVQLLAFGLLGEYVGRVLLNVNGKPQYVVRQRVDETPEAGKATAGRAARESPVQTGRAAAAAPAPAEPAGEVRGETSETPGTPETPDAADMANVAAARRTTEAGQQL